MHEQTAVLLDIKGLCHECDAELVFDKLATPYCTDCGAININFQGNYFALIFDEPLRSYQRACCSEGHIMWDMHSELNRAWSRVLANYSLPEATPFPEEAIRERNKKLFEIYTELEEESKPYKYCPLCGGFLTFSGKMWEDRVVGN